MGVNEIIQIGTRIKRIRMDCGFTQKQVATLLGIPLSTYSNYENNNREPNYKTIKQIASVLNISIDYLLYGEAGIINSDTASYLLTLAGLDMKNNSDGTYTLLDIQNGKIVKKRIVSNSDLSKFVAETSNYISYLAQKLFNSTTE